MTTAVLFALLLISISSLCSGWDWKDDDDQRVVLGHRGAAGIYPEHTLIAYEKGAEFGANFIECDLQVTKDLQLVCSHEAWIKEVCDVADREEFADRLATYNMFNEGNDITIVKDNFFTFDFSVAELKTLRRIQVNPDRDPSYNGLYTFVTFEEFVSVAKRMGVGIAPEIKSPTALNKILKERGIEKTVQDLALENLAKHGYTDFTSNCLLQCFEYQVILDLQSRTNVKRLFLTNRLEVAENPEILQKLQEAQVAVMCVNKDMLVPTDSTGHCRQQANEGLVTKIQSYGMKVYAYTFKTEPSSFCWEYEGDYRNELDRFFGLGLDGYFSDFPNTVRSFLDDYSEKSNGSAVNILSLALRLMPSFLITIQTMLIF